jgi:hypothetical protein
MFDRVLTCCTITGFFYFTPIVAAIIGETMGHWLHDLVARQYMNRRNGRFEPEARLTVIWFSTPFMLAGLVLLGFALQNAYHYMITSVGWGLYVFGIMITTVGLNAYVLDSYPEVRDEVLILIRCIGLQCYFRILTSFSH